MRMVNLLERFADVQFSIDSTVISASAYLERRRRSTRLIPVTTR